MSKMSLFGKNNNQLLEKEDNISMSNSMSSHSISSNEKLDDIADLEQFDNVETKSQLMNFTKQHTNRQKILRNKIDEELLKKDINLKSQILQLGRADERNNRKLQVRITILKKKENQMKRDSVINDEEQDNEEDVSDVMGSVNNVKDDQSVGSILPLHSQLSQKF